MRLYCCRRRDEGSDFGAWLGRCVFNILGRSGWYEDGDRREASLEEDEARERLLQTIPSVNENVIYGITYDRTRHSFSRAVQEDWVRT